VATYRQNDTIIGIAKQSAKGTANTTPDIQLWLASNSVIAPAVDKQDIIETTGSEVALDSFIASIEGKGDMSHFVMPVSVGYFFNALLGRDTKTGAGDPWSHTIDWGATPVNQPYYTILVSSFGSLYQMFVDCRLNHIKLEGSSNGLLMITCSWVGGVPQFKTSTTLAASAVEKTLRMRFADGTSALKFGGSALPLPSQFTFDADRGLYVPPSDTATPSDTVRGAFASTLSFQYMPGSMDIFNNTVYGASSPSDAAAVTINPYEPAGSPAGISFKWTPQAASPGPERSLTILMPRVQVDPFVDEPNTTSAALTRTVNVKSYGAAAGTLASPISAVVLNGQTAAY
jgi:hypothetical protein